MFLTKKFASIEALQMQIDAHGKNLRVLKVLLNELMDILWTYLKNQNNLSNWKLKMFNEVLNSIEIQKIE